MRSFFELTDRLHRWFFTNSISILRISVSIIFLWFGLLKLFYGVSPVQDLAISTIQVITFRIFSDRTLICSLAIFEILIGLGLVFKLFLRETLILLYFKIIGTFLPLLIFPSRTFSFFPFALTLEGQYIIKNIVILSAGIVIGTSYEREKGSDTSSS